ncbi:lysophospholipid acyltransferase family protein [Commensalibacter nepenthis]|uniref:Lauroyl acyltransferase n=1 Tax=Commensalibacter nepenthis TaxID=3043872 RepID=A0ABT6Q788_9PROT|nr:lauroyl acyltransferase [Commensalibacter sp. TBRC 10068]MDI2112764.1 lauroyl acyltransferase [Commensalibacter sp. TBRC 10068]
MPIFNLKKISSLSYRFLQYYEYILAKGCLSLLRSLSPEKASNIGGVICRLIGMKLPVSKVADKNLQLAMPYLTFIERKKIIAGAWENLGRTVAEFPHLARLKQNTSEGAGWEVVGGEYLTEQSAKTGAVLFVSGHIGNWEMLPLGVAKYGMPFSSFFRAASNPYVNQLILNLRDEAMGQKIPMFAKGSKGARQALKHLLQGHRLGVLSDQKMNDGVEVQFFGRPAMTSSAVASLALKLQCPIIPGYVQRLGPARLRIIVEPPIDYSQYAENNLDNIHRLTQVINDKIERWVKQNPEQWLWLHRRWSKELYR